jgi:hypothetical protein
MKARIIYPDDEKDWLKITSAKIISPNKKLSIINSTNALKSKYVVFSIISIFAVAAIFGFHLPEIIAEETTPVEYLSAEGVTVTGVFKFREGAEVLPVQVFTQNTGFKRLQPFTFSIEKVVGNTPYLHKHVDESFLYRNSQDEKENWNPFDVEMIVSTGPYAKRIVDYSKCFIDDYSLATLRDNEEGYFNKGFANVERITLSCRAMNFQNPTLDEMEKKASSSESTTTSTLDLKEPFSTWSDHFKYQNTGSLQPKQ